MKRSRALRPSRRGATLVLVALLIVFLIGLCAFAIDCGVLYLARTELQRGADSAALAAAWEALGQADATADPFDSGVLLAIDAEAVEYLARHEVIGKALIGHTNVANAPDGDVVVGVWDPSSREFSASTAAEVNAIQVRAKRTSASDDELPLFFAGVFGHAVADCRAQAVAYFANGISGFRVPDDQSNVWILPIAMEDSAWDDLLDGGIGDDWRWDADSNSVSEGQDGLAEVVLFPGTHASPGNLGTVNIGISANSTSHLRDQITDGLSPADFDFHGGSLDVEAGLTLTGDPGLSAGIKDSLEAVVGQPRIVPIYSDLSGSGNGAAYSIVAWGCVRIMEVQLTGGQKGLIVQPCTMVTKGAIEGTGGSSYIYAFPRLVQ